MTNNDIHFILQNSRAKHPAIIQNGLQLFYDVKGKKNTDSKRNTLIDMSGNNQHGRLTNFAYKKGSGFQDGLVFDGVDDTLTRPDLDGIEMVSGSRNLAMPTDGYHSYGANQTDTTVVYNPTTPHQSYLAKVSGGKKYTYTSVGEEPKSPRFFWFKRNPLIYPDEISIGGDYRAIKTMDSPSEANWLFLIATGDKVTNPIVDIQLEEGSTATSYVPYIPIPKMTYQLNGNIISYSEGGIVRRVQDGQVVERKGINLARNGAGVTTYSGGETNYARKSQLLSNKINKGDIVYISTFSKLKKGKPHWIMFSEDASNFGGAIHHFNLGTNVWFKEEVVHKYSQDAEILVIKSEVERGTQNIHEYETKQLQLINLTATFGVGNEPTLEQIQAEPEKWAWTPNPMDLLETKELKGNILGDMEGIVDDSNKDEVIGSSPIVSTKSVDSVVDVEVQGQSYQLVQTGNPNQFNTETDFWHEGSGSFEVIPDTPMGFHLIGGEELSVLTLLRVVKSNGDWTVSFEAKGSGTVSVDICDLGTKSISLTADWQAFSVTANVTNFDADWSNFVDFETTNSDVWVRNIKIETGTVKTPEPSPSPENPSPIINMNKSFDIVSSVSERNLLLDSGTSVTNGAYATKNYYLTDTNLKQDEVVTIVFKGRIHQGNNWGIYNSGGLLTMVVLTDLHKISEDIWMFTFKWKVSGGSNVAANTHISMYSMPNVPNYSNTIEWIKLVRGNSTSPLHVSAPEDVQPDTPNPTIYKTNISLSEPLRSVGDVKDRVFRDTDGLWKVERKVKEKIFDGTEGWARYNNLFLLNQGMRGMVSSLNNHGKSSHFKISSLAASSLVEENEIMWQDGNYNTFINMGNLISEVADFKTWLANNNVKVISQMLVPTIETLPDDLQQKLNNIQSYKGSNYVYTIDSFNLNPMLRAAFKPADWYKENLLLNSLKIYNRTLSPDEMLLNYTTEKERWGL